MAAAAGAAVAGGAGGGTGAGAGGASVGGASAGGPGGAGGPGAGLRGGPGGMDGSRPGEDQKGRQKDPERSPDRERDERTKRWIKAVIFALLASFVVVAVLACAVLAVVFHATVQAESAATSETSWSYPSGSSIPPVFWPIYQAAAGEYHVSPFLLASIHDQETGFSTNPTASSGVNSNGCCAGPMQFNIMGGSWTPHEDAFRPIAAERPASYPLDRRHLASCRGVPEDVGCVYDSFDAIAGAAQMLHEDGADTSLYSAGTKQAVCDYIGSCSEVEACTGDENQYCQVLPRAKQWEQSDASTTVSLVPGAEAKLLPDGLAEVPVDAPLSVRKMIAAGNAISGTPYELVHYPTIIDNPTYDCSSSTAHVLWAGGKFGTTPWCSSEFTQYGLPGPGKWVTIYAKGPCGPEGHVWMIIAGLRFDTSWLEDVGPNAGKEGPRWRTPRQDREGFVVRHPPGL
jgi:hypothetical protein